MIKSAIETMNIWQKCAHIERDVAEESSIAFHNARLLLEQVEQNDTEQSFSDTSYGLISLNDMLLSDINEARRNFTDKQLILQLYDWMQNEPAALIAALAIYDAHISKNLSDEDSASTYAFTLLQPVFQVVAEGLNLWSLRRHWLGCYTAYYRKDALARIGRLRDKHHAASAKLREQITSEIEKFVAQQGAGCDVEHYLRSETSLLNSAYSENDIARAIFLKITCKGEAGCYLALAAVEQQGTIVRQMVRNSFFVPEENGARRLQTAVRLPDQRLLVARIGTLESLHRNEWGMFVDWATEPPQPQELKIAEDQIVITKWTGDRVVIEDGSTVGDFVVQVYGQDQAQFCTGVYVNGVSAEMGSQLQPDSVVRIVLDRHMHKRLPSGAWLGDHKKFQTRQLVKQVKQTSEIQGVQGRKRILNVLQSYLQRHGFTIGDNELISILSKAGLQMSDRRKAEFEALARDTARDDHIRHVAICAKLGRSVAREDGKRLGYTWENITLAGCCSQLKYGDKFIGNEIRSSYDSHGGRFDHYELKLHRANCKNVTAIHHPIQLKWLTLKSKPCGTKLSGLIPDGNGILAEILTEFNSREGIAVHHVDADAINYGLNRAAITFTITAHAPYQLEDVKRWLDGRFKTGAFKLVALSNRKINDIMRPTRVNPYVTSADAEIDSDLPTMMVGREDETQRLRSHTRGNQSVRIAVVGYYRSGKTWFLKNFKARHHLPQELVIYLPVDAYPPEFHFDRRFARIIRDRILGAITHDRPQIASFITHSHIGSFDDLSRWINETTSQTGLRFTILFDEFTKIGDWLDQEKIASGFHERFYRFMIDCPNVNFVLVFQASVVHGLEDQANNDWNEWAYSRCDDRIEMLPFTQQEVIEMLVNPADGVYQFKPKALDYALKLTGGNPFLAAKLGRTIWRKMTTELTDQTIITKNMLRDFLEQDILFDPQWRSYANRLLEHVSPSYLDVLKLIATMQHNKGVSIKQISERLTIEKSQLTSLINILSKVKLLTKLGNNRYAVQGTILARYLVAT